MKTLRYIAFVLTVVLLAASCNKTRGRNGVLSEKAMADVLYDYNIANGLASEISSSDSSAILQYKYTQAVFAKHGITAEEFEMSMAHYARDPKSLASLSKSVEERLNKEIEDEQEAIDAERQEKFAQQNDTISAWENRDGAMLCATGTNKFCHVVKGKDLKGGNRLIFSVKTSWVYKESNRLGVMVLALTYDNDSTEIHTEVIRESNRPQNIFVNVPEKRKVKEARLEVIQSAGWKKEPQYLSLRDMVLWSIKTKKND